MTLRIATNEKRISVSGDLQLQDFRRLLAAIHSITRKQGYQGVELDFGRCIYASAAAMAAIVAEVTRLRGIGVETTVELPTDLRLRNLFMNAGWAYFLEPARFDESHFRGYTHVPLSQFGTPKEQGALVNHLVDTLLKSATQLAREDFAAVEWTLNEITDNVLVHSESTVGGFLHLSNYAERRRVELVVADPGIGIPRSLRAGISSVRSDSDALEQAIREGVTRSPQIGQGNGLYGSYRVAESSGGGFSMHAGNASLEATRGDLKLRSENIPHAGTLIVATLDYSQPNVLAEALRFGGKKHAPSDLIELHYEMKGDGAIALDLSTEAQSFGSRDAGKPVRTKILNLFRMSRGVGTIVIDLANVPLVSSSFADEVFGKLFVELGPMEFMRVIRLDGANQTVEALIDKAILQRSTNPGGERK